ncbi:MAG: NADPH-dependent FMN reductase [Opitutales bacterium]
MPNSAKLLIVSCSLNPQSRSAVLCQALHVVAESLGAQVDFVDLRTLDLPQCDGKAAYGAEAVGPMAQRIREADAIVLGVPIYNYDVNAAAKNLLELTGQAWTGKVVGFCCAAGGQGSFMSVLGLANSLMLDYRCLILPRYVYATGAAFERGADGAHTLVDAEVRGRVERLARAILALGSAVTPLQLEHADDPD